MTMMIHQQVVLHGLWNMAIMGFTSRNGLRKWSSDRISGQTTEIAEWRQEDPGVVPAGDVYGGGSPTGIAFMRTGSWRIVLADM